MSIEIYKQLIDNWFSEKSKQASFSFEGSVIGEYTLSSLFYEQIIKKALARLSGCTPQDAVAAEQSGVELNYYLNLKEKLKPIYSEAISTGFASEELSDKQAAVVTELSPKVFAPWVLLVLERDVLPQANNLEKVFVTQGF